jgi:hypothetical protein
MSSFLHEFYAYKQAGFFAVTPMDVNGKIRADR